MSPDSMTTLIDPQDLLDHQWLVVGITHDGRADYLKTLLPPGECDMWQYRWLRVKVEAEPTNQHDPNAVCVRHNGVLVGYIMRHVAAMMDLPDLTMWAILGTHPRYTPTLRLPSSQEPCPF